MLHVRCFNFDTLPKQSAFFIYISAIPSHSHINFPKHTILVRVIHPRTSKTPLSTIEEETYSSKVTGHAVFPDTRLAVTFSPLPVTFVSFEYEHAVLFKSDTKKGQRKNTDRERTNHDRDRMLNSDNLTIFTKKMYFQRV